MGDTPLTIGQSELISLFPINLLVIVNVAPSSGHPMELFHKVNKRGLTQEREMTYSWVSLCWNCCCRPVTSRSARWTNSHILASFTVFVLIIFFCLLISFIWTLWQMMMQNNKYLISFKVFSQALMTILSNLDLLF